MNRRTFSQMLPFAFLSASCVLAAKEGDELLGKPAPTLGLKEWIHSEPLDINDLAYRQQLCKFLL